MGAVLGMNCHERLAAESHLKLLEERQLSEIQRGQPSADELGRLRRNISAVRDQIAADDHHVITP